MSTYQITIDNEIHYVTTQFLTGKQIKILAGVTEEMERLAKASYGHVSDSMGWHAYKIILKPIPDQQILDDEEVDLVEEANFKFFTTCNGTVECSNGPNGTC